MTIKMQQKQVQEKREVVEKATCIACGRTFWATEAYIAQVKLGKLESICGQCDGSHDDDIDKAEYQHGDR